MDVGAANTPGFELAEHPIVAADHKGITKLRMPRNHKRLNQTSTDLLQSWRANCDVQLLIYDCHPDCPSVNDIARVTDYVVGYACKGSSSSVEEKQHMTQLILA